MIITIKVIPFSKHPRWALSEKKTLVCYVKSSPEKGKANQEVMRSLARSLRIPLKKIRIISGHTSRLKLVSLEYTSTYSDMLKLLGASEK